MTLGFRPEDSRIVDAEDAQLSGKIYSTEMTGHETIVTCAMAKDLILVKEGKDYDAPIDAPVHVGVDPSKVCLFDTKIRRTYQELRAAGQAPLAALPLPGRTRARQKAVGDG